VENNAAAAEIDTESHQDSRLILVLQELHGHEEVHLDDRQDSQSKFSVSQRWPFYWVISSPLGTSFGRSFL
jgi:hypothetical protein